MSSRPSSRRAFLLRGAAATAAGALVASPARAFEGSKPPESWLRGLTGKHRHIFDVTAAREGPLRRAGNYLDAYVESYGLRDSDLNLLFGVHGGALPMVLGDAVWARYALGTRYSVTDQLTKLPAVRNPFLRFSASLGWNSDYSIEMLQRRGVRFLGCAKTMASLARDLARESNQNAPDVLAELRANLLPGVAIVPAMVLAVDRAQEQGVTYAFVGG